MARSGFLGRDDQNSEEYGQDVGVLATDPCHTGRAEEFIIGSQLL